MSTLQRYKVFPDGYGGTHDEPSEHGEYVRFDDLPCPAPEPGATQRTDEVQDGTDDLLHTLRCCANSPGAKFWIPSELAKDWLARLSAEPPEEDLYDAVAAYRRDHPENLETGKHENLETGWRPAGAEPKDGREFQGWLWNRFVPNGFWVPRCRYNTHGAFEIWTRCDYDQEDWDDAASELTHWMPQPSSPETKSGAE